MNKKVKEFIKSASLNIVGGIGMIWWTNYILNDLLTSIIIIAPMIILSIAFLGGWLFCWDKIEKILNKFKKRKI